MTHVRLEPHDGDVAVLTLDRPPANAMDLALLEELVAALETVAADVPGALVVAGRDGLFSAGVDLKAAPGWGRDEQRAAVAAINAMALGVYGLPCPVVGAITGHAIAGGMVLALGTDVRVAADDGRYGLTEVAVGVPFPVAALGVAQAELAPHAARLLALGAELHDAATCARLGVFDEIVAPHEVLPRALERAAGLARLPARVYAATKRDLRAGTLDRLRAAAAADPLLDVWLDSRGGD